MEALGRGAWKEARSALEDAARADESPDILFGLGVALWWLGEIQGSVRCMEQAYAAFRRRSDLLQAANAALELSFLYHENLRSEEHTSELQSRQYLVCRLLLEK